MIFNDLKIASLSTFFLSYVWGGFAASEDCWVYFWHLPEDFRHSQEGEESCSGSGKSEMKNPVE
jgi:hypothetical protein